MTGSDLVLHFVWPPPTGNDDMRTVRVKQVPAEGGEEIELYKVRFSPGSLLPPSLPTSWLFNCSTCG